MSPDRRRPGKIISLAKRPFEGMRRGYHQIKDHKQEAREAISEARFSLEQVLVNHGISDADLVYINSVIDFAYYHHLGQRRFTGEPYITHPLKVAAIVAENPNIKNEELREHVELALCHDLLEDTHLTEDRLRMVTSHPRIAAGVGLLSKLIKSKNDTKINDEDYFRRLVNEGTPMDRRVKIADWIHNLQTTPKLTADLDDDSRYQISKFQRKFEDTSKYIIPLIRTFDDSEKQYLYSTLSNNYNQYKPDSAPDLEPLAA